ncbi:MAG TPA: endopeptidase La [Bacilli bacterium]|nr:endopeptidase La [Bacilli bacterium]
MLENLPVLLLKKLVLLPYQEVRLELNADVSKKVVELSEKYYDSKLLVVCPNNSVEISPSASDLPNVGVLAKIKSRIELPNGNFRVIIDGLNRVNVREYWENNEDADILECTVKRLYIQKDITDEETALVRTLKTLITEYMKESPEASNAVTTTIGSINDLDMLTDIITNFLPFDFKKKVSYMNEFDYIIRANNLVKDINVELEVINIESKIDDEIRDSFAKEQRDYILRQKVSKLNKELGINVDKQSEVSEFNEKINALDLPLKTKDKLLDEVKKYSYTALNNPDSNVIRSYLDTVLSLPWNKYSKDESDLKKVKKALDKDHYGYEEAKQRILEFIAIKKNNGNLNGPIICLVGPPGTGKTTFGMSVSKSLNREFYKISVGGMSDASELTGHRRTYLGSSPGKIIQGLRKCGTSNPVILIDEVDKMLMDYHGDPSAVLLDILDPNQNSNFVDNYIEESFDLSKVLFILTANDIRDIPDALKDRLEIIEINSYTEEEKINIAKKYMIPLISTEYNLPKVKISDENLKYIIKGYTYESGVRDLERNLRKIGRNIIINELDIKSLTNELIDNILGSPIYNLNVKKINHVGNVSSLGVTPLGGIIVPFESILTSGKGVTIMGNIEDSVKESAMIAYNYISNMAKHYGIDQKQLNNNQILINALNYNIKKDGTSGGLAILTSMISLLLNIEIPQDVCFTGEITLHGDVCGVGGIKEKLIGAYNKNYHTVFMSIENKNDVERVPQEIKQNLNIIFVSNYEEIMESLFYKI